ncbi:MAG: hypothetical protein K2K57_00200 [Oscillospiraceae bacterium]|nr:hypothetical protein [Oscillospiraceae bacterium]
MKMNSVKKINEIMMIGLAVNWALFVFSPIDGLYLILFILFYEIIFDISFVFFWLCVFAVFDAVAFWEIKKETEPGRVFLFLGSVGAVIAVNTVNREYGGKEKVYKYFSVFIWLFVGYPVVFFVLPWCIEAIRWGLEH